MSVRIAVNGVASGMDVLMVIGTHDILSHLYFGFKMPKGTGSDQ